MAVGAGFFSLGAAMERSPLCLDGSSSSDSPGSRPGDVARGQLDGLLASCLAVVQPSLEEGYGLPAVEAAAVGVPIAASPVGYAPSIPEDLVSFMDPLDEASIASAIDAAAGRPDPERSWLPRSTLAEEVLSAISRISASGHSRHRHGT